MRWWHCQERVSLTVMPVGYDGNWELKNLNWTRHRDIAYICLKHPLTDAQR